VTWVEFDPARFEIVSGAPSRYEARPQVTRQCCPTCGTQLTYERADEPEIVDVTACSLDEPEALVPEDHVWSDRMLPWIKIDDGLPRYRLGRDQ